MVVLQTPLHDGGENDDTGPAHTGTAVDHHWGLLAAALFALCQA